MNSYKELVQLGSGVLIIDPISGSCLFNNSQVEQLSIAYELQHWLIKDAAANNIPFSSIVKTKLEVNLLLERLPSPPKSRGSFYIGKDGKPVEEGEFYRLTAEGKSSIATDEAIYESNLHHKEQWPVGWPNT